MKSRRAGSTDRRCGAGGNGGRCPHSATTIYEGVQPGRKGQRVTVKWARCDGHPMNRIGRPITAPGPVELMKRARDEVAEAIHALGAARDYYRAADHVDDADACARAIVEVTGVGLK